MRRAAEEARSGVDLRGVGGVFLLLNPEQRELFTRMQAMMSLLEGHASFVMNEVARDHVKDVERMRRALAARRRSTPPNARSNAPSASTRRSSSTTPASGSSATIVERAGMETFNLVWRSAGRPSVARGDRRARALGRPHRRARVHASPSCGGRRSGTGHGDRARARDVPARADRAGRGLGRAGLRLPVESLLRLRRLFRYRLEVVHVDHGLRPAPPSDAAYVKRLAPGSVCRSTCGRPPRAREGRVGGGVGAEQRHFALAEVARETDAARIALGPHGGRSGGDRAAQPHHRQRAARPGRDRAGRRPYVNPLIDVTPSRWRPSAAPWAFVPGATRRTSTPGSCATRSG